MKNVRRKSPGRDDCAEKHPARLVHKSKQFTVRFHLRESSALTRTPSRSDPAQEAYENAVGLFKKHLTEDECKRVWLKDKTDMQQVQSAVNAAKDLYEARSQQSKAKKWLVKFSERVMHYGKIMDTLANYNPEYCALAWGTMKFLLMVRLSISEL